MLAPDDVDQIVRALETHPSFRFGPNAIKPAEDIRLVGTSGNPAFLNAWGNIGAPDQDCGFFKDQLGLVHVVGAITGDASKDVFILPDGYIPASTLYRPAYSDQSTAAGHITPAIRITSDGHVKGFCSPAGFPGTTNLWFEIIFQSLGNQ